MSRLDGRCTSPRLVGDPIDVVTGANVEQQLDFTLPGPIPLEWRRYYDSSRSHEPCPLGWGHTHEYDRRLRFDLDGMRYTAPSGEVTAFPFLGIDGAQAPHEGLVLERLSRLKYVIHQGTRPSMYFVFRDSEQPARLVSLVGLAQQPLTFHYGPTGLLEAISDSRGHTVLITNRAGLVTELVLVEPGSGKRRPLVNYRYDETGNLVEGVDPYRNTFRFSHDTARRMKRKTDRLGYSFHYTYDDNGRCVGTRGEDGLQQVHAHYLLEEHTTRVTRPEGGEWVYQYDSNGTLTRIIDPYGGVQLFRLDDAGRVIEEVDPNGNITRLLYDEEGNLLGRKHPLGRFTPVGHEPGPPLQGPRQPVLCPRLGKREDLYLLHAPTALRRPASGHTLLEWDYGGLLAYGLYLPPPPEHRVLAQFPASVRAHVRTAPVWPPAGPVTKHRQPLAPITYPPGAVTRDFLGVLVAHTDAYGGRQRWRYDANGNVVEHVDREAQRWQYSYRSWNQLERETDPLRRTASYSVTAAEKLSRLEAPGGSVCTYEYDLKGRLSRLNREGATWEEYRYDLADNLLEKRDGQGCPLLSLQYGAHNLVSAITLASGEHHSFGYDERGRLIRLVADGTQVSLAYDADGNLKSELRDGQGVTHGYKTFRVHTKLFERFTTLHERFSGGFVLVDPGGARHAIHHHEHGLVQRTFSTGVCELSQYDWRGQCLRRIRYRDDSGEVLGARRYDYSPEGNLVSVEDDAHGTWHYAHDAAHRLIQETLPDGTLRAFQYDPAGNLLKQPGLDGVLLGAGNCLLQANGERYEYDARRRLASRTVATGQFRYHYDSMDRLVRAETPEGQWRAQYDALGRRLSKTFQGRRTDYYWDGDRLAAEVFAEGQLRIYVYADPQALTPILFLDYDSVGADPASARRYFIFTNQVGAPILVEDGAGQAVWEAELDPYGRARILRSEVELNLRFPGHHHDPETGLHYNRFRYYSPELGRYIQPDPLDVEGGLNLYAYTPRPLIQVDVDGLGCPVTILLDEDISPELRQKAIDMATKLRDAAMEKGAAGHRWHKYVTYAVSVVRKKDGSREIWITTSHKEKTLPLELKDALGDDDYVFKPGLNKSKETHLDHSHHAEQALLHHGSNNEDVVGIETISPTRPCCSYINMKGCAQAIVEHGDPDLQSIHPPADMKKANTPKNKTKPANRSDSANTNKND